MDYSMTDPVADESDAEWCTCDEPDPIDDEPWVRLRCGNCGLLL